MVLLDNDEFLSRLTKMFQKSRTSGSVLMTIKQYDGRNSSTPREKMDNSKPATYSCLVRATSKNKKLSTVVDKNDVVKFQKTYSHLLRANLDGLKKLKKEKNKPKGTQ